MADNRIFVIQKRVPSLTSTAEIAKIANGEKFITTDTSMEYYKHETSGAVIPFGGKDVGILPQTVTTNKETTDTNELGLAIASLKSMLEQTNSYEEHLDVQDAIAAVVKDLSETPKANEVRKLAEALVKIEADLSGKREKGYFNYGMLNQFESSNLMDASTFEYLAEFFRTMGQSGIINTRSYGINGNRAFHRSHDISFAALNMHDHPNTYNLPGTAEIAACLNGYYIRTRHNDYRISQPSPAGADYTFNKVDLCPPPTIPPSVLALATPEEQIEEMRQYFIAYDTKNTALRDYRPYFTWTLSYFEVWLEVFNDTVDDPFSSPRHSLATNDARQLLEMALYFNYGGHKNRAENLAFMNKVIRYVDVNGIPQFATLKWRICAIPVGDQTNLPYQTVLQPIDDIKTLKRYNQKVTDDAFLESRRCKFYLDNTATIKSFSGPQLIDQLMAMVPGKDGAGAVINETYDLYGANDLTNVYGTSTRLNIANYNRFYSMSGADASGRSNASRGFNDPTLWVAATTQTKVVGVPSAKGVLRFTYAVPLEMILHTPLENEAWNPYKIPLATTAILSNEAVSQGGVNNSTDKVYSGYNSNGFFHLTPKTFFSGTGAGDPADTDPDVTVTVDGVPRQLKNSGTRCHLPLINGITKKIRQRYPVYPSFYDGSHAEGGISVLWEEIKAIKTSLSL